MKINYYDPNLIFVGFPQYSSDIARPMRNLMNLFAGKIGPYSFIPFEAQSFSAAKARNIICAAWRKTDAGKLLMIDSDMNAGEAQVERILGHPEQVIGGIYPKKILSEDPQWVVNFAPEHKADARGVSPCIDVGAGFLKIERTLIEKLVEFVTAYYSDDAGSYGEEQHEFFNECVRADVWGPGSKPWARRLGEDFAFCHNCKRIGVQVYVDTLCQVGHIGPVDFLQVYALLERARGVTRHGENAPVLPEHT